MKITSGLRRTTLAMAAGVLVLSASACGSSSSFRSSADSAGGSSAGDFSSASKAVPEPAQVQDAAHRTANLRQQVIETGSITITGRNLSGLRSDVLDTMTSLGGTLADEQTSANRNGQLTSSRMVLRVPNARFDAAMKALGGVGKVVHSERSAKDVTTQVIDVNAQVSAQRASLRRMEQLLTKASSVREILAIENQIADRQGQLQSLTQQQTWLQDQVAMSTITVVLDRNAAPPAHHGAFVSGLLAGWDALVNSLTGLVRVLGAVLPWLIIVGPLGWIAWWLLRRRRSAGWSSRPSDGEVETS